MISHGRWIAAIGVVSVLLAAAFSNARAMGETRTDDASTSMRLGDGGSVLSAHGDGGLLLSGDGGLVAVDNADLTAARDAGMLSAGDAGRAAPTRGDGGASGADAGH